MRARLGIVGAVLLAMSGSAAIAVEDNQIVDKQIVQDGQPRGERYEDRWQGRRHILHDDDLPQEGTDGNAANARAECRAFAMRENRPDGTTVVRREQRCE